MGKNLSPVLRREFANLDKDAGSRKSAMKTLKSCVKDLDSKAIPLFLAQVSETKECGSSAGEYTISLYEVLARVHGRNIVPQIDNIMSTIVKTLMSSAGSFPLHQACSKVAPAIARYSIDPLTPDNDKAKIMSSLCKPLFNILMGSPESITAGAALCLKTLVESDNWRFASDDIVNDVCLRVAGALEEKLTQTTSHMGLAMALAKHNSLILEAYARSLVRSGLQILTDDAGEGNSQKRFSVIQMVNILIKCVDSRSICSELATIVGTMEKCYSEDQMPFVRAAAFEAMQTAKMISAGKVSKLEKNSSPVIGSNFSRSDCSKRSFQSDGDNPSAGRCRSPRFGSPESHTVDSFSENDSFVGSPLSTGQVSCNYRYSRPTNRRLWKNENGYVDVSLKDGLYSEDGTAGHYAETYLKHYRDGDLCDTERDHSEGFAGFVQATPTKRATRSATPSPQRQQSKLNIDDIRIFRTPRKLIHSLQDPDEVNTELPVNQAMKIRTPTSHEAGRIPIREINGSMALHPNHEFESKRISESKSKVYHDNNAADVEMESDDHESVSSTGDGPVVTNCEASYAACSKESIGTDTVRLKRQSLKKVALRLVFCLSLILPAIIFSAMQIDDREECTNLVPT